MSVRRLAAEQPESFEFTPENKAWAETQIAKYPAGRQASAVIPLLWQAQKQNGGWVSEPAIRHVGEMLDMAYIRVLEVATFYTMFNLEPVGQNLVQLCGTTPCWLRGADDLKDVCRKVIGPEKTVSADGALSWMEVECLGACVNAPMVQINDDFYEDLDAEKFTDILNRLRSGEDVTPGPQTGRQTSAPEGGRQVLTGEPPYHDMPYRASGDDAEEASGDVPEPEAKHLPERATPDIEDKAKLEADGLDEKIEEADGKAAASDDGAQERPQADLFASGDEIVDADADADAETDTGMDAAGEAEGEKPEGLSAPQGGQADDLKLISGIGPKLEGTLNGLGIYHFSQIAGWTRENVAWVDEHLSFKGRIDREEWIPQARGLAGTGGDAPPSLDGPRGGVPDDLRKISGVGPKIEGILHSLGIYHFDQIAAWTDEQVGWVDERLKFKGRIGREDWISQARELAAGSEKSEGGE